MGLGWGVAAAAESHQAKGGEDDGEKGVEPSAGTHSPPEEEEVDEYKGSTSNLWQMMDHPDASHFNRSEKRARFRP